MPELPDVVVYVEALSQRILGQTLRGTQVLSPLLLRTFAPALESCAGRQVAAVWRLGKRIVVSLEGDVHLAVHLMIAGRMRWLPPAATIPPRLALARFDFGPGTLWLTEAGRKRRAALHVLAGLPQVRALHAGGVELFEIDVAGFLRVLRRENHTLKRALTDPRLFSGIGNAYSDEILHGARLSPVMLTARLRDDEGARLFSAARDTLSTWTDRLRTHFADRFPGAGDITAFRDDFAVHGRYGRPCPVCGRTVQRIRYADHETHYCPTCQTGGRLLADRSLSRLLREDWPRTAPE